MDAGFAAAVQALLQFLVQGPNTEPAAVHRRQHLDVFDRVEPETLRDALGDDLDQLVEDRFRRVGMQRIEIAEPPSGRR